MPTISAGLVARPSTRSGPAAPRSPPMLRPRPASCASAIWESRCISLARAWAAPSLAIAETGESGTPRPDVDGIILAAPAVWGYATMNLPERVSLWTMVRLFPTAKFSGSQLRIVACDNRAVLEALGRDPLVIKETRVDAVYGLVNLMTAALDAAPKLKVPLLLQYGAHDQIVPRDPVQLFVGGLPRDPAEARRLAYYPHGYHMIYRDPRRRHGRRRRRELGPRPRRPASLARGRRPKHPPLAPRPGPKRLAPCTAAPEALIHHPLARGPVAQLDRALPSEGRGRTFESYRVRQSFSGELWRKFGEFRRLRVPPSLRDHEARAGGDRAGVTRRERVGFYVFAIFTLVCSLIFMPAQPIECQKRRGSDHIAARNNR